MIAYNIPLESFTPKRKSKAKIENGTFYIPTEINANDTERHYVYFPEKYKLPFRIDMNVKIKYTENPPSQFMWNIGKGDVYFNGGHISCTDIITGEGITPDSICYSEIPLKDYVNISVMYGSKTVWVTVDGKYCFSSRVSPYISLFHENTISEIFSNGFDFSIRGGSKTMLEIKSLTITEYENDEPEIPEEIENTPKLSSFDLYVRSLPPEIQVEMLKTNEFFLNDMKNTLKFKRAIDKYGHLTYKSPCGFQYAIPEYGVGEFHETTWDYMKKPDYTDVVLKKLADTSPEFADKMFSQLWDCPSPTCKRISKNEYNGKSKIACHSSIVFKWTPSDFEDLRKLVSAISEVVKAAGKNK